MATDQPDLWEPVRAEIRAELARRQISHKDFAVWLGIHPVSLGRLLNSSRGGHVDTWVRMLALLNLRLVVRRG